jgi:signal transduction histidine kinase
VNRVEVQRSFWSAVVATPKPVAFLAALVLVALIGWFNYATGSEVGATVLYALPILLAVWTLELRLGLAVALLCMVVWGVAQVGSDASRTPWGFGLALATAGSYFAVLAYAAAAVKAQWELGRARIEMLERTRQLERDIVRASEQEQHRIGRELHDGLCQTLAGIAALSTTLSRNLVRADTDASAAAAEIAKLLNEAIGEARSLARGLGPIGLHEVGLAAGLENLALNVTHQFGVSCSLDATDKVPRPDTEIEGHLFRIAQQAVHNAVTHGRASRIEISLSRTDKGGVLRVRDDGVGIPEGTLRRDGTGLNTMTHRAHLIGGALDVHRRTPRGTTVTCVFPLLTTPAIGESLDHAQHGH